MRGIKGIVFGCICAMCLHGNRAGAQKRAESGPLSVSVHTETEVKSYTYLKVKLQLDLDGLRLGRKQSRTFTPVLNDGINSYPLRPVVANGIWRERMHRRALKGEEDALTVLCGKKGAGMVEYTDSCIYQPWMKEAKLWLAEDLCGCGGNPIGQSLHPLLAKVDRVEEKEIEAINTERQVAKTSASVKRKQEAMCQKVARVTLYLDFLTFPVNRTDILPDFGNNRSELGKLTNALDSLLNLPEAQVELVNMTGYASPEGPYTNNERLAYGRTVALRDYLQKIVRYRELSFRTASVAEDWEGLKKEIEVSDMPYREELLLIIATNMPPDEKEEKMKLLDRGSAYKILKRDFLLKLRKTVCEIHYTVKEDDK